MLNKLHSRLLSFMAATGAILFATEMTQDDATAAINAASTKLDKIKGESEATVQKALDLQAIIDSMNAQGQILKPELSDAIAALIGKVNDVDNVVQDLPPETPITG